MTIKLKCVPFNWLAVEGGPASRLVPTALFVFVLFIVFIFVYNEPSVNMASQVASICIGSPERAEDVVVVAAELECVRIRARRPVGQLVGSANQQHINLDMSRRD